MQPLVLTGLITILPLVALFIYQHGFRCPSHLRHIPQVPLIPTIISFFSGETESERTLRLLLPVAKKHGSPIVTIWALGDWYVHVLDHRVARILMDSKLILKQPPRREMMFWRFVGSNNVFFADGEAWRRHAQAVREVLHGSAPIHTFLALTHKLFAIIGDTGRVSWSDLAHRFTLDVVGHAVIGHNFEALERPENSLVQRYRKIIHDVSHPLYVGFPALERWLPRHKLCQQVDELRADFTRLIDAKRETPGEDFVSFMLAQSSMSDLEYLDNVVSMFMAGHDTTAGAVASVVYYLAVHPHHQERARREAQSVLLGEPGVRLEDIHTVSIEQFQRMPFIQACIRESMRLNSPSLMTVPRISKSPIQLGEYVIPPDTPVILNLFGTLRNESTTPATSVFQPERWLASTPDSNEEDLSASDIQSAWIPFSIGPRRCPAMNFSLYEQRTVLAMLLCRYRWALPADSIHKDGVKNEFCAFALNVPYDLQIEFDRIPE